MSSGALRAAWEAAQKPESNALRRAWEQAQHDTTKAHDSGLILRRNERGRQNDAEAAEVDEEPSYAQKALGGVASLARDIPGAEVLQAGARSVFRRQPYSEALEDIRGAEDASGVVGKVNRGIGGVVGYSALPAKLPGGVPISNMARGAVYGALNGATDADPEADRAQETLIGGAAGGALGAAADVAGSAGGRLGKVLRTQAGKEKATAQALVKALSRLSGKKPLATESAMASALTPKPGTAPTAARPFRSPRGVGSLLPESEPSVTESAIESATRGPLAQSTHTATPFRSPRGLPIQPEVSTESAMESALRPRSGPPPARSVDELLRSLIGKMRAAQPHEIGNIWGDAEIAQGLHLPEPDLETLLRLSLKVKP